MPIAPFFYQIFPAGTTEITHIHVVLSRDIISDFSAGADSLG
jgi:hypothetical protein